MANGSGVVSSARASTSTWSSLTVTALSGSSRGLRSASGTFRVPVRLRASPSPWSARSGETNTRASARSATRRRSPRAHRSMARGERVGVQVPPSCRVPSPNRARPSRLRVPEASPVTARRMLSALMPRSGTVARPSSSAISPSNRGPAGVPPRFRSPRTRPCSSPTRGSSGARSSRRGMSRRSRPLIGASRLRPLSTRACSSPWSATTRSSCCSRRSFSRLPVSAACWNTRVSGGSAPMKRVEALSRLRAHRPRSRSTRPPKVASARRRPSSLTPSPSQGLASARGRSRTSRLASIVPLAAWSPARQSRPGSSRLRRQRLSRDCRSAPRVKGTGSARDQTPSCRSRSRQSSRRPDQTRSSLRPAWAVSAVAAPSFSTATFRRWSPRRPSRSASRRATRVSPFWLSVRPASDRLMGVSPALRSWKRALRVSSRHSW